MQKIQICNYKGAGKIVLARLNCGQNLIYQFVLSIQFTVLLIALKIMSRQI